MLNYNSIFHLIAIRNSLESLLAGMMQRKDLYTIRKSSSIIPKVFSGIVHLKSLPVIFIDKIVHSMDNIIPYGPYRLYDIA